MFAEDHGIYLADFGVDATLDGQAVRVIFDNAYTEVLGLATRSPRAGLPSSSAGSAQQGSVLVVSGTTYQVASVQPDGTGWTELMLERQ